MIAQVPMGINPTTSMAEFGVFFVPWTRFLPQTNEADNCFSNFEIGHYRDDQGYESHWYDVDDAPEDKITFYATIPANDGDLYFANDAYYWNMIPGQCTTGIYTDYYGDTLEAPYPLVLFSIFNQRTEDFQYQYYYDQTSYPILVSSSDYQAGDIFEIEVFRGYMADYPAKDYTVRLYSKQAVDIVDVNG